MNWKIAFGVLFFLSVTLMIVYANKNLIVYDKTTTEEFKETYKNENGGTSVLSHPQNITRTYQDNYAAIGGAIGFGILAAASLLAFASAEKNENSVVRSTLRNETG